MKFSMTHEDSSCWLMGLSKYEHKIHSKLCVKYVSIMRCYAVPSGEYLQTFHSSALPTSSGSGCQRIF
jgi:hypothetical protein